MNHQSITPKQQEILYLIYRYRFLNRIQIQHFLHHKHRKRINSWLKNLTDKQIIGRKYSRKLTANNQPAIYHLATKSRNILLERDDTSEKLLKRVYQEKLRSKRLINHCTLVADIYFWLVSKTATTDKLHFFTKADLANHYYLPYQRPDAYIAVESKDQTKRYFLEIIDPGTPRFMIRKKISSYVEYFDEGDWYQKTSHSNPSILLVCPDETTQTFIHRHTRQVLEEEVMDELKFFTTTTELIQNYQVHTNLWWQVK